MRVASLLAMAGRPTKAKMPKHYPIRGLFSNTPVRVVRTDIGNTVAADPAPDDQPAAGVGNAAGEPQPATEEEPAPAKKHAKLNLNDLRYACFSSLSSNPPRMNCTICDTHLRLKSSPLLTKHCKRVWVSLRSNADVDLSFWPQTALPCLMEDSMVSFSECVSK